MQILLYYSNKQNSSDDTQYPKNRNFCTSGRFFIVYIILTSL